MKKATREDLVIAKGDAAEGMRRAWRSLSKLNEGPKGQETMAEWKPRWERARVRSERANARLVAAEAALDSFSEGV